MKKVLFVSAILLAVSTSSFAQKESDGRAFSSGSSSIHLGVGFGGGFYTGKVTLPPVSLSYEKAVSEKISVGAIVGYSTSKFTYFTGSDDIKYIYLLFGARGNYHFGSSSKFDPYLGLTVGYNSVKVTVPSSLNGYAAKGSAVLIGGQLGANYYFSSSIGLFGELGYGIGIGTIGLAFKF